MAFLLEPVNTALLKAHSIILLSPQSEDHVGLPIKFLMKSCRTLSYRRQSKPCLQITTLRSTKRFGEWGKQIPREVSPVLSYCNWLILHMFTNRHSNFRNCRVKFLIWNNRKAVESDVILKQNQVWKVLTFDLTWHGLNLLSAKFIQVYPDLWKVKNKHSFEKLSHSNHAHTMWEEGRKKGSTICIYPFPKSILY